MRFCGYDDYEQGLATERFDFRATGTVSNLIAARPSRPGGTAGPPDADTPQAILEIRDCLPRGLDRGLACCAEPRPPQKRPGHDSRPYSFSTRRALSRKILAVTSA